MKLIRKFKKVIQPKFISDIISENNSINASIFFSFLRKENSLDKFKKYWKDEYFFDKVGKEKFLLGAFDWNKTDEKADFWSDLHRKWVEYLFTQEYAISIFDRYAKERGVYGNYRRTIKDCDLYKTKNFCEFDISKNNVKYNDSHIYYILGREWERYYRKYVIYNNN